MKILITGVCGFVGSSLARGFLDANSALEIFGIDNLSRAGSELNRPLLKKLGVHFLHGDIRNRSDVELLPDADWVIDAAANPSVLAGVEGSTTRQLLEHNVLGTVNVLEYCRRRNAGLILLSTSRVYSVSALSSLPLERRDNSFYLRTESELPPGVTCDGIAEDFSTSPPLSLYGVSKFVSERLALEYGEAFRFPVWVNRCGVMSGAGQFGRADQGILSFWIHACHQRRPLAYIGFGGHGHQARDFLHPRDLVPLLAKQMERKESGGRCIFNVAGGIENSFSLAQLNLWCSERFGPHPIRSENEGRAFDVPWLVLNSGSAAAEFDWRPQTKLDDILVEVATHAEAHPEWLERTQS
jgi:CDP-paratose 2-epimerase